MSDINYEYTPHEDGGLTLVIYTANVEVGLMVKAGADQEAEQIIVNLPTLVEQITAKVRSENTQDSTES